MGIKPGDRVAIEINGKLYTDVVTSIKYESPTWTPPPPERWWERAARRLRIMPPAPTPAPDLGSLRLTFGGQADEFTGYTLSDLKSWRDEK